MFMHMNSFGLFYLEFYNNKLIISLVLGKYIFLFSLLSKLT